MIARTIAILILAVVATVLILLYYIYEPFLDIIESAGQKWVVICYNKKDNQNGRECKRLFKI